MPDWALVLTPHTPFMGVYGIWQRAAAPHLIAALLRFVLFGAVVAKYAYPTSRVRRLVTARPELCATLIESDVVVLRKPTA
jgi:hypothetical protein